MTESSNLSHDRTIGEDDEINLIDLVLLIAENLRLLIFAPLAVGLMALGISFLIKPTYTASTLIIPPQQQQSAMSLLASQLGGLAASFGISGIRGNPLANPSDIYVTLITSRTVTDGIIDRFKLMQVYGREREEARDILATNTNVTAGKDGLISIEVKAKDPKLAADMANAYVEGFSRLSDGLAITEAQQRRAFYEARFHATQESLSRAQLALAEVGMPESVIKSSPAAVVEVIARLRAQIEVQEIKLSSMRGYLTEQSPDYRQAQRELSALRAQLAQVDQPQPVRSKQHAEYLNRFRDFKYQEAMLEFLAKQLEAARLDEAHEGALVQVVDVAVPPERRSWPKRAQIATLTALATGIILLLIVFARESLRGARNNPESARKLVRIGSALRRLVPGTHK
jgi:uncharacterized protein involved in exopolysaccharide biosynthesis